MNESERGHAADAGNHIVTKAEDLEFKLKGGRIINYGISILSVPKIGSGGTPPVPGPVPGRIAAVLRCPLGKLLYATVAMSVPEDIDEEEAGQVLERRVSLALSESLVVAFRVLVMTKHGGMPETDQEMPDMRLSCLLSEHWKTEVTGVVLRAASIVIRGGGSPPVPPPPG